MNCLVLLAARFVARSLQIASVCSSLAPCGRPKYRRHFTELIFARTLGGREREFAIRQGTGMEAEIISGAGPELLSGSGWTVTAGLKAAGGGASKVFEEADSGGGAEEEGDENGKHRPAQNQ